MNRCLGVTLAASLIATAAPAMAQSQDAGQDAVTVPQETYSPGGSSAGASSSSQSGAGRSGFAASAGQSAGGGAEACGADAAGAGRQADGSGQAAAPDLGRIDALTCAAGALPDDQSAITVKVQTLLDRAGVSPGVIDGWQGGMTRTAIADFERREGLSVDGEMDGQVWELLSRHDDRPITQSYTITEEDAQVVGPIPADYSEQAGYERLGYQRVTEALAEKFHMDEEFLQALNPGAGFAAGETITVMVPGEPVQADIARVEIDKQRQRLYAMDANGGFVASYPVTIGSDETPSPSGTVEVTSVTKEPWYNYDPENFIQGDNHEKLSLPPGPNNPVGMVWIALNKPSYGIHGTPGPSELFTGASHGCVRMTNWDALALADMVSQGTVVEFRE